MNIKFPIKYYQNAEDDFLYYAMDKNYNIFLFRRMKGLPLCWEWVDREKMPEHWEFDKSIIDRKSIKMTAKKLSKEQVPLIEKDKIKKFKPFKIN